MFNFDNFARTAFAAVCSLVLTTVAVGATIGPVETGAAAPAVYSANMSESANG